MKLRTPRPREVVVGLAFVAAALFLVWAGTNGSVRVFGTMVDSRGVAAGLLVAGFAVATVLSLLDGDEQEGIGDLVAVLGWLCLLVAAVTIFDFFAVVGVVLVLGAGAFLVAHGLGIDLGVAGSGTS